VICGRARYKLAGEPPQLPAGIRVRRLWGSDCRGGGGLGGKAADYATFFLAAAVEVARVERADVVVTLSTPPMLGCLGAWAKRRGHGRFVFWVQDIYPEIAQRLGVVRSRFANALLEAAMESVYRAADRIVALGERMAVELGKRHTAAREVDVVQHWPLDTSPGRRAEERRRRAWENDFVILYSGNLGRAHDVRTFLEGFEIFAAKRPAGRLAVAGDGAGRAEVAAFKRNHPGLRIELLEHQPRGELAGFLEAADVHLITQKPEVDGLVVPSKLYGILESGRPFCFVGSGDNEIGALLSSHRIGFRVEPGDAAGLAAAWGKIAGDPKAAAVMGEAGRQLARSSFSRDAGLLKLAAIIEGSWKDQ
jgi:glycosyltransferase involved in cell wall biosynthesis